MCHSLGDCIASLSRNRTPHYAIRHDHIDAKEKAISEYIALLVSIPVVLTLLVLAWMVRSIRGHDVSVTLKGLGVMLEVKSSESSDSENP